MKARILVLKFLFKNYYDARYSFPNTCLGWLLGLQEVEDIRVSRQSVHEGGGCQFSSAVSRSLQNNIRFRPRLLFMFASPSTVPIPVAARSKAWVCGRSLAEIAASNPAGALKSVFCECCVFYR